MKTSRKNAIWLSLAAASVSLAMVICAAGTSAQEKADGQARPAAQNRERAEPRGRLPNYYRQVVSGEQREKIYAIQQKYRPQLQELQEKLQALRAEQQSEIDALLTADQISKIKVLEAEARAARAKAAAERAAEEAKAEAAKAAEK